MRLAKYRATEVPVRYPAGDPKQDPRRCRPPLDYWFAGDEAEAKGRCNGEPPVPPPPPPPPSPSPPPSQAVYFHTVAAGVEGRTTSCLAVDLTSSLAVLVVGACNTTAKWFSAGAGADHELESAAKDGLCMNVLNQTQRLGRCKEPGALIHLNTCGRGPGNRFEYTDQQQIVVAGEPACAGLCVAPTLPIVTLEVCSSNTKWKRVSVLDELAAV